MTRNFQRWEVDPFFTAAEVVQDSADRLELAYRTWVHAKSVDAGANEGVALEHFRRELSTALGTAKWQLEEFERAVSYLDTDEQGGAADDTPARHKQFVVALQNQFHLIERSLLNSGDSRDLKVLPVLRLGREEKEDLALFLCGSKGKSHEESKKIDFCISSINSDGKNDEEITSESVKSSNEVSECFSTSVSSSEKFSSGSGIIARIGNGHFQSGSTGSGFRSWKNGSADNEGLKTGLIKGLTSDSKLWPPFFKNLGVFDKRLSKSGLKRWKDGDMNSMEQFLMLDKAIDLEKGPESSYIGGTLDCSDKYVADGNILYSKRWSGASEKLQYHMYAFFTSQFVHKASAILVASGFVGFIFFRMTLSAL